MYINVDLSIYSSETINREIEKKLIEDKKREKTVPNHIVYFITPLN